MGKDRFSGVDIRVRVKGGGHVAQIYGKFLKFLSNVNILVLLIVYVPILLNFNALFKKKN